MHTGHDAITSDDIIMTLSILTKDNGQWCNGKGGTSQLLCIDHVGIQTVRN